MGVSLVAICTISSFRPQSFNVRVRKNYSCPLLCALINKLEGVRLLLQSAS